MGVYVDPLRNWGWRYGASCHLVADSVEELHAFAARIGLKPRWFQDKSVPHYDLTAQRRAVAVRLGAVQIDFREMAERIQKWKRDDR